MSAIIGIDLGTSTSEAAFINDSKRPEIIKNKNGGFITPSVVYIDENHTPVVGEKAAEMAILEPENTVIEVKRLMGSDEKVTARGREYTPQEISSYILSYLKECAEEHLGETISRAVITVPAYFTDAQRKATIEAGELAGLTVLRIVNEPTAASLDYGILHMEECKNAVIYDLGGGTLDVTTLELFDGVIDVKSTCGNNKLGGLDFDNALMEHLIDKFKQDNKANPKSDKRAYMRIKNAAVECKIALSSEESFKIELPFLMEQNGQPLGIDETITRELFESLIVKLVESTSLQIKTALREAQLSPDDVDLLLLVGGSTKIPLVSSFIEKELGIQVKTLVDPDLAVVKGAAIQAGIIDGIFGEKGIILTDVCPFSLSIEALDNSYFGTTVCEHLIEKNTTIPAKKEKVFATSYDNQTQANIRVYQGESEYPEENMLIGEFMLKDIPARRANKEKIIVEFSYDLNGILVSKAKIASNDKSAEITIDMNTVKEPETIDLTMWEKAKSARKYRAVIKKAEKALKKYDDELLDEALCAIKKALIMEQSSLLLEMLKAAILDLIYDLEENDD